ncbi:MAG: hypothetical protein HYZ53_31265 [Planctomycetes bacterium]|nr:hypothetical protein [Planctomycetota bacterium]
MSIRSFASTLGVLTLVLSVAATACADGTVWEGKWSVAGTHTVKGNYTGSVTTTRVSGNKYSVQEEVVYADGKHENYSANATLSGSSSDRTRSFKFSYKVSSNGMLDALGGGAGATVTVSAKFTGTKKSMSGSWYVTQKRSVKGTETWTKADRSTITAVEPKEVGAGTENRELTILGTNLPRSGGLNAADVAFLAGTAADPKAKVTRILDFSDNGSSIKVALTVAKDDAPGKRSIKIGDAVGKDLLTITPPEARLKLGGSATATTGGFLKLFVPDNSGGELTLSGATVELHEKTTDGAVITGSNGVYTFCDNKAGWYFVKVTGSGNGTISARFVQKGEVKGDKKPWNFWYFPFYERGANMNLYSPNGTYEKFDQVLGLKHDPDGYKKFSKYRHMDSDKFKEPTTDEEKAKYDQNTTKGWAYCYARSTDSKKSWWGHCWGAVVASSIYKQPKAATLKGPDGKDLSFNEEEAEGLLTDYFTNHSVNPVNYVNECPPGRPTDKLKEDVDEYADDFLIGLQTGIRKNGLPLASNLRAASTGDDDKDQVWNHVIWKYEARFLEVEGKDDATYLKVELDVTATDDVFPSSEYAHRDEAFVMQMKYDESGNLQRDSREFQNWVSADHFCPSYLWRIESATSYGTENEVLGDKLSKLESLFKHAKINP